MPFGGQKTFTGAGLELCTQLCGSALIPGLIVTVRFICVPAQRTPSHSSSYFPVFLPEMRVQTQVLQILAPLTPPAQSTSPRTPSTKKQHGQEPLSSG